MNEKIRKSPVIRSLLVFGIPLVSGVLFLLVSYYYSGSPVTNIVRLITGVVGLLGFSVILLVRYLAGSWPGIPIREDEDDIDSLMRFNKINAPMQNRRENLVIILWLAVVISLLIILYKHVLG